MQILAEYPYIARSTARSLASI